MVEESFESCTSQMPRNTSKSSRYVEIKWSIDWQQGNYVTNTIKEIILRTLFLTQISECLTLREEIFAGINFFSGHFAGINFLELGFTEDFVGINFPKLSLTNDFAGINFRKSALRVFHITTFSKFSFQTLGIIDLRHIECFDFFQNPLRSSSSSTGVTPNLGFNHPFSDP